MTKDLLSAFLKDAHHHIGKLCKGKMSISTLSLKRNPSDKHLKTLLDHIISIENGAHFIDFDAVATISENLEKLIQSFMNGTPLTKENLAALKKGCKKLSSLISKKEKTSEPPAPAPAETPDNDTPPSSPQPKTSTKNSSGAADIWTTNKQFVAFRLGDKQYAVPIFQVSEIRGLMHWTKLPKQNPAILGLVNLRGLVLPLFDLRVILGLHKKSDGDNGVILILKNGDALQAFLVDTVTDVVELNRKDRRATPRAGNSTNLGVIRFIGQDSNDSFLMVIDIEKITNLEKNI